MNHLYSSYEDLPNWLGERLENLASDPVQFSEFTHSADFLSALEQAKNGDVVQLENLIRLREISTYYLTQTLVTPQTADRHLSKYFADLEREERDVAVILYSDFRLNLCLHGVDGVTVDKNYLSKRLDKFPVSPLLLKRIVVLLFHTALNEAKFEEAKAIKESFALQKNEIYHAIISACRSHNNINYEALPNNIREYNITSTGTYKPYWEPAAYICKVYNSFDISASDIRQLGIPKIVRQILWLRDFDYRYATKSLDQPEPHKLSTLLELVLWHEDFQEVGAHAIRNWVIANYLSIIQNNGPIISNIMHRCGFDTQYTRKLIIQWLKYEYAQGRNSEVLKNACAFYNITEKEVYGADYLENVDEEYAWIQVRNWLIQEISTSERETYENLIKRNKEGRNLDSVPLEYIPQVVEYIIKLARDIYDSNITIRLEEGEAMENQRRNWLSDFKYEFSEIFSNADKSMRQRPRLDTMWKEVLSFLERRLGSLRQETRFSKFYKIVGNESNPLETLYFSDKRMQLKEFLSDNWYEHSDEIYTIITELYLRQDRGGGLANIMGPKEWLNGIVLQKTYDSYVRLIDELVSLGLGKKIKTQVNEQDFDTSRTLSNLYHIFGLGANAFAKIAERDPQGEVYDFEFSAVDYIVLMKEIESRIGAITPSWVNLVEKKV